MTNSHSVVVRRDQGMVYVYDVQTEDLVLSCTIDEYKSWRRIAYALDEYGRMQGLQQKPEGLKI